jgi:hypothetical protein
VDGAVASVVVQAEVGSNPALDMAHKAVEFACIALEIGGHCVLTEGGYEDDLIGSDGEMKLTGVA